MLTLIKLTSITLDNTLDIRLASNKIKKLINDILFLIKKQDDDIRALEEALRIKQTQFEACQRDYEMSIGPKVDERIKHEKMMWEQEQNYLIRRELNKLNEEKCKEIAKFQDELNVEKEKFLTERDKSKKLEKVRSFLIKYFKSYFDLLFYEGSRSS